MNIPCPSIDEAAKQNGQESVISSEPIIEVAKHNEQITWEAMTQGERIELLRNFVVLLLGKSDIHAIAINQLCNLLGVEWSNEHRAIVQVIGKKPAGSEDSLINRLGNK